MESYELIFWDKIKAVAKGFQFGAILCIYVYTLMNYAERNKEKVPVKIIIRKYTVFQGDTVLDKVDSTAFSHYINKR